MAEINDSLRIASKADLNALTAEDVGAIPISLKGQALRVSDLMATFAHPTLVEWGSNTSNTPYKAGLTTGAEGFAIVHGEYSCWHTVVAWQKGGTSPKMWIHHVNQGTNFGWKEPLWADGSVPMSGNLTFKKADNGKCALYKNHSATVDGGVVLQDDTADGVSTRFNVRSTATTNRWINFTRNDGTETTYSIFGEHNKPSGSYTGNGSATKREIAIGGIGSLLVIEGGGCVTFVTKEGSFMFNATYKNTLFLNIEELVFEDGVLTIATAEGGINGNGIYFTYHLY